MAADEFTANQGDLILHNNQQSAIVIKSGTIMQHTCS